MKSLPLLIAAVMLAILGVMPRIDAFPGMNCDGRATLTTATTRRFIDVASGNRERDLAVMGRTTMFALNKKKKEEAKIETRQVTDPLELFILYATPWRNPNSIFVYLLAGLYVLGKYSEAHHGM